jgi:hypothetical protein
MADKDFVVKNGFSVNGAVLVVNSGSSSVGINTNAPDATLKVAGTANVTGNAVFSANVTINGAQLSVGTAIVGSANATLNVVTVTNVNATNLSGNGSSITSVNAAAVGGNTASTLRSYSDTTAATAYSNAASYADTKAATAYSNATAYADTKAATAYSNATAYADTKAATAYSNAATYAASIASSSAATAYSNAVAFSANATNLSSGTVNTSLLPATINIGTALNVGSNVTVNASVITIGNSTVNFTANSSAITGSTNATFNIISGNGVNITSVNAAAVGGNTASTLRSYSDTVAATAYSNGTSYAASVAATAYSNAVAAVPRLTSNATTYVLGGGSVTTNTFTIGTAAYYVSNGNFGLGTSSPGYKLDVNGTSRVTGSSAGGDSLVIQSPGSAAFFTFKPEAIAGIGYFGYYSGGFTTVYTPAGFSVGGSVGVGTTSPAQALDVRGTTVSNTYTSQGVVTLTDGSTITCDTTQGNFFQVTLGGNRTFALAATPAAGTYIVYFIQDGTGSRTITWPSSNWKWAGGSAPVMTTAANKLDVLMMVSNGTVTHASMSLNY